MAEEQARRREDSFGPSGVFVGWRLFIPHAFIYSMYLLIPWVSSFLVFLHSCVFNHAFIRFHALIHSMRFFRRI